MNLGVVLEVAIGLTFVWVLLSLITSQLQDWIASWLKWRSDMLEESLKSMLGDPLATEFYSHPLIKGLHTSGGTRKPSYIPNRQFAAVIVDLLLNDKSAKAKAVDKALVDKALNEATETVGTAASQLVFNQLKTKIAQLKKSGDKQNLARVLDTLLIDIEQTGVLQKAAVDAAGYSREEIEKQIENARQGMVEARKRMETWYDDAMERLSGAYKRRSNLAALIIGMSLALILNADSLAIADSLWRDPLLREALVAQAEQFQLPADQTDDPAQAAQQYISQLQDFSLPLGWSKANLPSDANGWIVKLGGIMVSGAAAAQGAPFWFEMLRKLLNIRPGGKGDKDDK